MKYYSTNKISPAVSLETAVTKGLAPDKGLYMPEEIHRMSDAFFENITEMSFIEIATEVARNFFGEDIDDESLKKIVSETLNFDCPAVKITDNIYSLELFHGPTLAFKDVGARFMARMLQHFNKTAGGKTVDVLVATSGDTGSAVANGFLGVDGIRVFVLYPKGKVSRIQECQFTTLGSNITAIEVDGTFDDCQRLVKSAFTDPELNSKLTLTSANSINIARFLPQSFYYFYGYAQLRAHGVKDDIVVSVPSGNFGNLCAALFAHRMGLPVKRFIAANNANDVFYEYLTTGKYSPRPSVSTIANAMDVGDPSNFARILDLFGNDHARITRLISGSCFTDEEIKDIMRSCYRQYGYVLDPHGACAFGALQTNLKDGETGLFCETAHPAKFIDTVEETLNTKIEIPDKLKKFMSGQKTSVDMSANFDDFKSFLINL